MKQSPSIRKKVDLFLNLLVEEDRKIENYFPKSCFKQCGWYISIQT